MTRIARIFTDSCASTVAPVDVAQPSRQLTPCTRMPVAYVDASSRGATLDVWLAPYMEIRVPMHCICVYLGSSAVNTFNELNWKSDLNDRHLLLQRA
ncbi:MAG TPA: hypothetical protein VKL21_04375 [Candidatus Methanoperedens sp.]|nr:hypothetical protein [Candidatus Methanoperedens sp.]